MRFSAPLFVFSTVALLAGCAYVIPPAQNAPRNNEVRGEIRRPQYNHVRPQSAAVPAVPMQQAAEPELAPVDAQARVVAEVPMPVSPRPVAERQVPLENQPFQTASMGYEPITHVPPRPVMTGPESTHDQLRDTQIELERSRANAYDARDALARDAATEPSMLSDLPKPAVRLPSPSPVEAAPPSVTVPTPQEFRPRPSSATTPRVEISPVAAAPALPLPPEPLGVMPEPTVTLTAIPKTVVTGDFDPLAAAERAPSLPSTAAVTQETIVPVSKPIIASAPLPAPVQTGPSLGRGDFDPLAAAENAPVVTTSPSATPPPHSTRYATNGMFAPSRYYTRRY